MQARFIFPRIIVIRMALLFCVSSAFSQGAKAPPPVLQAGQQVEAVRPVTVNPLSAAVPKESEPTSTLQQGEYFRPVAGSDLLIQSGDLLAVSLYGIADFNKEVRVTESGDITLPLIGDVHVAGLTIQGAEALLEKRLVEGSFFTDPQISIAARESASQGTSVLGEVQKPGIYYLPGQHWLFDALSAAGGTTPRAGNAISITHRGHPNEAQTVNLPPNQTLPPERNVVISPGDTIVVSKAGIVYVLGDVRLPGGFVMDNANLTILQAVAMAQGTNPTAKLDHTILIRRTAEGKQEIPVPLSKVMAAGAPDPTLQADDVIFIPRSDAKAGFRRGLEAALQTLVGVAIYRPI